MTESDLVSEEVVNHEEPVLPHVVDASVWRLGANGFLLASVREEHAGWLAEQEPNTIFFYADLNAPE